MLRVFAVSSCSPRRFQILLVVTVLIGAGNYPYTIATNVANNSQYNWAAVPDTGTASARIKVIDARGSESDIYGVSPKFNIVGNFIGYLMLSAFGPISLPFYESLRNLTKTHLVVSGIFVLAAICRTIAVDFFCNGAPLSPPSSSFAMPE